MPLDVLATTRVGLNISEPRSNGCQTRQRPKGHLMLCAVYAERTIRPTGRETQVPSSRRRSLVIIL